MREGLGQVSPWCGYTFVFIVIVWMSVSHVSGQMLHVEVTDLLLGI